MRAVGALVSAPFQILVLLLSHSLLVPFRQFQELPLAESNCHKFSARAMMRKHLSFRRH